MSEATIGLGEAWGGYFSPTIVFQAGPHHCTPDLVPDSPVGQKSISVAPQAAILGLCL